MAMCHVPCTHTIVSLLAHHRAPQVHHQLPSSIQGQWKDFLCLNLVLEESEQHLKMEFLSMGVGSGASCHRFAPQFPAGSPFNHLEHSSHVIHPGKKKTSRFCTTPKNTGAIPC
jgi:hypothetical protein